MLEPRPEMRTPTRAFSAMVVRGPGRAGAPALLGPGDGAALLALGDSPDREDNLTGCGQFGGDALGILRRHDRNHADAAVEGPRHLARLDIALRLEEGHQPGLRPGVRVDEGVKAL